MSGISKEKVQKQRFSMAIEGDKSALKKLLQKKPRKNEESKIQQSFIKWFSDKYPQYGKLLFAIPNGGKRSKVTASILKSEGVKSGVADLFLSMPKLYYGCPAHWKHGLYIETKTEHGEQSPEQKKFQKAVEAQGYEYTICRSIDEFIKTINDYL